MSPPNEPTRTARPRFAERIKTKIRKLLWRQKTITNKQPQQQDAIGMIGPGDCFAERPAVVACVASYIYKFDKAKSRAIQACDACMPGHLKRQPGAAKPFCMECGRDL